MLPRRSVPPALLTAVAPTDDPEKQNLANKQQGSAPLLAFFDHQSQAPPKTEECRWAYMYWYPSWPTERRRPCESVDAPVRKLCGERDQEASKHHSLEPLHDAPLTHSWRVCPPLATTKHRRLIFRDLFVAKLGVCIRLMRSSCR